MHQQDEELIETMMTMTTPRLEVQMMQEHIESLYHERDLLVSLIAKLAQRLGYPIEKVPDEMGHLIHDDWQHRLVVYLPAGPVSWSLPVQHWPLVGPIEERAVPAPLVTYAAQHDRLRHPFGPDKGERVQAMQPMGLPPEDCAEMLPTTQDLIEEDGITIDHFETRKILPGSVVLHPLNEEPTEAMSSQ